MPDLRAPGMTYPAALPAPLYRGSVNTWECDDGGHLNVRFHVERAMIGLAHLANQLEMPRAFTPSAGATLVPLQAHIRFLKEARPGAPLVMHGGVVDVRDDSALVCLDMRHGDGAPSSVFSAQVAHADARSLRRFPWSGRARAAAQRLTCAQPPHALPRSIDPAHPAPNASRARAISLGAERIGATVVFPDQCDAFGRLRGEHLIGRVSDSVPTFLTDWRADLGKEASQSSADVAPAGAVVEARFTFGAWPRAGDLIEIYSAIVSVGEKTMQLCHWICDPESGGAWATMEVVALTFDAISRKTIAPSPELRARMQARAIPEMAL